MITSQIINHLETAGEDKLEAARAIKNARHHEFEDEPSQWACFELVQGLASEVFHEELRGRSEPHMAEIDEIVSRILQEAA